MKTRQEIIDNWNESVDTARKTGGSFRDSAYLLETLLDIRELMVGLREDIKAEQKMSESCKNCGLLRKFWDLSFCLEGRKHY